MTKPQQASFPVALTELYNWVGVYQISCLPTGKVYIGSSVDIRDRFNIHLSHLRNDKHINKHLQRSWNKYGESSFKFEVLQPVFNLENLPAVEEGWILNKDFINPEKGFNQTRHCVLGTNTGKKFSAETKAKISAARLANAKITIEARRLRIEASGLLYRGPRNPVKYGSREDMIKAKSRPVAGYKAGKKTIQFFSEAHARKSGYRIDKSLKNPINLTSKGLSWYRISKEEYQADLNKFCV